MKHGVLLLISVMVLALQPGLSRADTRVYVTFSVGGAVVVGAGIVYWGVSYSSRVSEHKTSVEAMSDWPGSTTATTFRLQSDDGYRIKPDPVLQEQMPVLPVRQVTSPIEIPLLLFRW